MKPYIQYCKQIWLYLTHKIARRLAAAPLTRPLARSLDMAQSHRVNIGHPDRVVILLAGCGGTGSFAAHSLAQLAVWAKGAGLDLRLVFIDPDRVEEKNLVRQNFCRAEIGYPKAFTLAWRYSNAFGLSITPVAARFSAEMLRQYRPQYSPQGTLMIVVGAVDNACARRDIAEAIDRHLNDPAHRHDKVWWIDSGNERVNGQILAGNSLDPQPLLSPLGYCTGVPLPHIQEPGLLVERDRQSPFDRLRERPFDRPRERPFDRLRTQLRQAQDTSLRQVQDTSLRQVQGTSLRQAQETSQDGTENLSCAELTLLGQQSAMINRMMATWLGIYLYRLLQSRDLDLQASYVNLRTGMVRSEPITGGRMVLPEKPPRPIPVQIRQIQQEEEYDDDPVDPDQAEPDRADPDRATCPNCGRNPVIEGQDTLHGETLNVVFCGHCNWREYRCPACGEEIAEDEIEVAGRMQRAYCCVGDCGRHVVRTSEMENATALAETAPQEAAG